jgi:hypothetical protein
MKALKTTYNTDSVLALSIAIDRDQGFIKSGFGYYDYGRGVQIHDNKTAIAMALVATEQTVTVTDEDRALAQEIKTSFKEELIAKKLMNKLNTFEESVLNSIANENVDNFGVSILASLPNSYRVQKKRQHLDNWFDAHRATSEFVGKIGDRVKFEVEVKDVKFIAKFGIHLVTCINDDGNIVKFFFNREPDIAGLLEGKRIILTGKVKTHDVSKFSDCKETVLNYVKIENKG